MTTTAERIACLLPADQDQEVRFYPMPEPEHVPEFIGALLNPSAGAVTLTLAGEPCAFWVAADEAAQPVNHVGTVWAGLGRDDEPILHGDILATGVNPAAQQITGLTEAQAAALHYRYRDMPLSHVPEAPQKA